MAAPASVGLDIGSVSVRAVTVVKGKDRPLIDNFGQVALPEGAVVGGVVKDERAVAAAVRELWSTFHVKPRTVRLGVAHQQVVVREVELANLPAKEMRLALPHQARDVLPLPVDQAVLDFYPLEPAGKAETVRGLLVAAPREAVLDTVHAVEKAGLLVEKVDLSCFAILRAIAAGDGGDDPVAEVIADIGASSTTLVIHVGGVPQIVRTIPRGGNDVTALVADRLRVSTGDAELLKRRDPAQPPVPGDATADPADLAEAVAEACRPLLREISSSIAYFAGGPGAHRLARLVLLGGGARLPGLAAALGELTKLPVRPADPFQYVAVPRHRGRRSDLAPFASSAAVAVGLTLGAAS